MPFGGYKDFADCVKQNSDKSNPEAYCGEIQSQAEEGGKSNDSRLYKRVERLPITKSYKDSDKKQHIAAYISSTLRDRDGDRFDKTVLEYWAKLINSGKINLGTDHGRSWKDTMGVWKKAELRHNPNGDDINQAKWYLYADAVLEDPDINKDAGLLIHKSEIGEQISLSISANPAVKNWYDLETEQDGSPTRVIKSAELLKADIVGEPANPDARSLGTFLKHLKEQGCSNDCIVCQFDNCVKKSMMAPNTKIEQSVSSLVTEKESKPIMTEPVKKSQEELNKEHGCKEGEHYCPDEGKCMPAEETKSVNKDQGDCPPGHKYNTVSGKCEKEEDKSTLSPELSKFIEALKVVSTTPEAVGGLEAMIERALEQTRAIESAIVPASPGLSGTSGAKPQATSTPSPQLEQNRPIETANVVASPGLSGTGPAANAPQATPAPQFEQNRPIESAQVQASDKNPQIRKIIVTKPEVAGILLNKKRTMEYIEKARLEAKPKNENPGEITLSLIDTTTLTGPLLKAAKEYNKNVIDQHASQVRQQYTPADLVKMAEAGKLVSQLDQDGNFEKKVIPAYAKTEQKIRKTITGTLLLQKHR